MKITTTDGKEYYLIENCPYCHPNTAGQHDISCPNYDPPITETPQKAPHFNAGDE